MNKPTPEIPSGVNASQVKEAARGLGFDLVGIASASAPGTFPLFKEWLEAGYAGEMGYLERREEAYRHPEHVMEGVRSILLLGMNYAPAEEERQTGKPLIARYARGERDYHDVIRERLKELSGWIKGRVPQARTRGIVDTAPLLERDFAREAGLGWFGKNTMLINRQMGSWFFLAGLLTDLELEADAPFTSDHCGTCTRCLEACPTQAFTTPYVLDARRCISYLTIELKGEIPIELREEMGEWIFGCDICQEVCPWNRKAPATREAGFVALKEYGELSPTELLQLDENGFRERFGKTPLARPGREGILRNLAIMLGNKGEANDLPALRGAMRDESAVVREAAEWSVKRIEERRETAK